MKKILISLNSWNPSAAKYLTQTLDNYADNFKDYAITVALSTAYPFEYSRLPVVKIERGYGGQSFCWNNRGYLIHNYDKYDYIIDSDDDILISRAAFDYYIANESLPLDTIPGFLSFEQSQDGKRLITINSIKPQRFIEDSTIGGKRFVTPFNLHSACFIADKARFALALKNGLSAEPCKAGIYTIAEYARSQIYTLLKKLVSVDSITDGGALVEHLSKRYLVFNIGMIDPATLFTVSTDKPAPVIKTKAKMPHPALLETKPLEYVRRIIAGTRGTCCGKSKLT